MKPFIKAVLWTLLAFSGAAFLLAFAWKGILLLVTELGRAWRG